MHVKHAILRYVMPLLCRIVKLFGRPGPSWRQRLKFKGPFILRLDSGKSVRLWNQGYFIENELFWLGGDDFDWEKSSRKVWEKSCREANTILDIGANTGLYAMLAKVYKPDAAVHAFEPQPNIFSILKKNNDLNGFDVYCHQLALSNQEGTLPFYNYGEGAFSSNNTTAGSLNQSWRPKNQSSIDVPVTTLSAFVHHHNLPQIDLIKMDVETLEPEVLEGYGALLAKHKPVILIEIQNVEIGRRIETLLDGLSYSFYNIQEGVGLREVRVLGEFEEDRNYLLRVEG